MARLRLVLMALLTGAASLAAGLAVYWLTAMMPCSGEGLACNIDDAIGGYGVLIFAGAGTLVFLVTLLIAKSRKALAVGLVVLLLPILLFALLSQIQHASTIGFEPYRQLRTVLAMIAPPVFTVLVQYAILRLTVTRRSAIHNP